MANDDLRVRQKFNSTVENKPVKSEKEETRAGEVKSAEIQVGQELGKTFDSTSDVDLTQTAEKRAEQQQAEEAKILEDIDAMAGIPVGDFIHQSTDTETQAILFANRILQKHNPGLDLDNLSEKQKALFEILKEHTLKTATHIESLDTEGKLEYENFISHYFSYISLADILNQYDYINLLNTTQEILNPNNVSKNSTPKPYLAGKFDEIDDALANKLEYTFKAKIENSPDKEKILERMEQLPEDKFTILMNDKNLFRLLELYDLPVTFENISNVLEIVYSGYDISLRTPEENEANKSNIEAIKNRLMAADIMENLFATVANLNNQFTENLGPVGLAMEAYDYNPTMKENLTNSILKYASAPALEGLKLLLNYGKSDIESNMNRFQYAKYMQECAQRADKLKAFDKEKFEEGFKNILGEYSKEFGIKYDEKAFVNLVEIINNKKAQNPDGSFTDEYTEAIKKALNFIPYNANDDTARKIVYGVGEAALMLFTLGKSSELKSAQIATQATIKAFTKAGVKIASKEAKNALVKGAYRMVGKGVSLAGPMLNEAAKMGGYTLFQASASNIANRTVKGDWENFWQVQKGVFSAAGSSAKFGAFAVWFGSVVTSRVTQLASKTSEKVAVALSEKFAKGAVSANEVYATIIEKSAPTLAGEITAFTTDVLGFTGFEVASKTIEAALDKNKDITADEVVNLLKEEFKGQSWNLGQIKGISYLLMWMKGSRSARLAMSKAMSENIPALKGVTVEQNGKGYRLNLPDGRKIECKNMGDVISAHQRIVTGQTAFDKRFDMPKEMQEMFRNLKTVEESTKQATKIKLEKLRKTIETARKRLIEQHDPKGILLLLDSIELKNLSEQQAKLLIEDIHNKLCDEYGIPKEARAKIIVNGSIHQKSIEDIEKQINEHSFLFHIINNKLKQSDRMHISNMNRCLEDSKNKITLKIFDPTDNPLTMSQNEIIDKILIAISKSFEGQNIESLRQNTKLIDALKKSRLFTGDYGRNRSFYSAKDNQIVVNLNSGVSKANSIVHETYHEYVMYMMRLLPENEFSQIIKEQVIENVKKIADAICDNNILVMTKYDAGSHIDEILKMKAPQELPEGFYEWAAQHLFADRNKYDLLKKYVEHIAYIEGIAEQDCLFINGHIEYLSDSLSKYSGLENYYEQLRGSMTKLTETSGQITQESVEAYKQHIAEITDRILANNSISDTDKNIIIQKFQDEANNFLEEMNDDGRMLPNNIYTEFNAELEVAKEPIKDFIDEIERFYKNKKVQLRELSSDESKRDLSYFDFVKYILSLENQYYTIADKYENASNTIPHKNLTVAEHTRAVEFARSAVETLIANTTKISLSSHKYATEELYASIEGNTAEIASLRAQLDSISGNKAFDKVLKKQIDQKIKFLQDENARSNFILKLKNTDLSELSKAEIDDFFEKNKDFIIGSFAETWFKIMQSKGKDITMADGTASFDFSTKTIDKLFDIEECMQVAYDLSEAQANNTYPNIKDDMANSIVKFLAENKDYDNESLQRFLAHVDKLSVLPHSKLDDASYMTIVLSTAMELAKDVNKYPYINDKSIDKVMKKAKNVVLNSGIKAYTTKNLQHWLHEQNRANTPKEKRGLLFEYEINPDEYQFTQIDGIIIGDFSGNPIDVRIVDKGFKAVKEFDIKIQERLLKVLSHGTVAKNGEEGIVNEGAVLNFQDGSKATFYEIKFLGDEGDIRIYGYRIGNKFVFDKCSNHDGRDIYVKNFNKNHPSPY